MNKIIVVKNLSKSYGPHKVLRGLNLEVIEGETLVIIGRSGAGKSVLLRALMGLEKPDSGSISIRGVDITVLKPHDLLEEIKTMGMLFQSSALFDSMNLYDNVAFYLQEHEDPLLKRRLLPHEIKDRVQESLQRVGLHGNENKMPSELSGGMKKRAAIARLIAYRPQILFYDEPTTGLDPMTARQINDLILKTQRELGATSIVVTHDIASAFQVADRIALNHEGRIAYIETKSDFRKIEDDVVKEFLSL